MTNAIEGVVLTPLKKFNNEQGSVYHALKKTEENYAGFGEAYFSTVKHGVVKGWKKHTIMLSNLIVPVGEIRFVLFDDRPQSKTKGNIMDVTLSIENYYRLSIPVNIWLAFQGIGKSTNLLLNISSITHDPNECKNLPIENTTIPFNQW